MGRGERIITGKALIKKHKKIVNKNLWRNILSVAWRQTSKHVTSSFHKNWKGRFKNLKGFSIGGFSHLLLPSPPSLSFLFRPRFSFRAARSLTLPNHWKEKRSKQKKNASYALAELYKPFSSLSFSVAPDENSDRQQQNSGRDTKWNVNNFVNDSGIFWCRCGSRGFWCRCGSRGFYDWKQNKYITLWSKVLYYKWKWGSFFQ